MRLLDKVLVFLRLKKKQKKYNKRLTVDQVSAIKEKLAKGKLFTQATLARLYNTTQPRISDIAREVTWKNIKPRKRLNIEKFEDYWKITPNTTEADS